MQARKIRYDESFIAADEQKIPAESEVVQPLESSSASYVPSPARALQEQIKDQLGDAAAVQPKEKYSTMTSFGIIVSSSLILWAGLIITGIAIF